VILSAYDGGAFPKFACLFEPPPPSSALRLLARPPEEAPASVVLENRSAKAITALRYRWTMTDASGKSNTRVSAHDSYRLDVFDPVAQPGSRHLLSPVSGSVAEALIDHVLAGGGCVAMGGSKPSLTNVAEVALEFDLVLFADGEIAGADRDGYTRELQCRKPAAEFVVRQVRLAMAEGRDVTPVLKALAEIPCIGRLGQAQSDPLVHWTRYYAEEYLRSRDRKIGETDWAEATLRHLENRPDLPRFYRRGG
jgi:hypothetical protein